MVDVICISNMPYLSGEGLHTNQPLGNLTIGKKYRARWEGEWLRVWDDYDEDYLYPARMFEEVKK